MLLVLGKILAGKAVSRGGVEGIKMLCRSAFGEMLSPVNGRKLFEELKAVVIPWC